MERVSVDLALEALTNRVTDPPASTSEGKEALEFAWRVHSALDSWTGKVDTKASIALAIESAIVGFVITLSDAGSRFGDLGGRALIAYCAGVGFLLFSVLMSLLVVLPQLNRRQSRRTWSENIIYFGHLRHWQPDDLAAALRAKQPSEDQLSRQLVAMARIAWRKHAWLQWSLVSLVAGSACLTAVAIGT